MNKIFGILILAVILLGISACSSTKDLSVDKVWARPGFQGDNSAVYFAIRNPGDQSDVLLRAISDAAGSTEIHHSKMDSEGIMTMEQQDQVPIPVNDTVEFAPGGLHVMLVSLSQDLSVKDTFPITLVFQNHGEMSLIVEVKQP
jgi:copper(I)-binding protein